MKEKIFARIKTMKREQMIIFLLLFGIVIVISIPVKKENNDNDNSVENDTSITKVQEGNESDSTVQQLEEMLKNTLQKVEGVGEVAVAITMESTGKK